MRSHLIVVGLTAIAAATGCDPAQLEIDVTFDPCHAIEVEVAAATDEQRASIDDALAMWRDRGVAAAAVGDGGATRVTIAFSDAASAFYGFYNPATGVIHINTDLRDRRQRAVTIAHELGHAFGLAHVERDERASVMNRGNLTTTPTDGDQHALESLWGTCRRPVVTDRAPAAAPIE